MNRIMISGLLIGLLVGSAQAQPNQPRLRIFFDEAGVGEKEERVAPLSFENPDVAADSARFYLYVEYGNDNESWSMDLNIAIEGDGEFALWQIYNNFASIPRWNAIGNASGSDGKFIMRTNMVAIFWPGATNIQAAKDGDFHYRQDGDQFGTTLLGYIDVTRNSGNVEIFLEIGKALGGKDDLFNLGFGDEPVENKENARSTGWDARVVTACDPCDANCDGSVDLTDVEPFIQLLFGKEQCNFCTGDTNDDGSVDLKDVEGFIECLLG